MAIDQVQNHVDPSAAYAHRLGGSRGTPTVMENGPCTTVRWKGKSLVDEVLRRGRLPGFDAPHTSELVRSAVPYCFFGFRPLFDAPSRQTREPMDWLADACLAYSPLDTEQRRVVPLLGFSWGPLLEATYPDRRFVTGLDGQPEDGRQPS